MLSKSYQEEFKTLPTSIYNGAVRFEDDALIDEFFTHAEEKCKKLSDVLINGSAKHIPESVLPDLNTLKHADYLNNSIKEDTKLLIFNIEPKANGSIHIGEINFDDAMLKYDMIVIGSTANKVTFSGGAILHNGVIVNTSLPAIYEGNKLVSNLASKIIFNFPNASDIDVLHYGVTGSILAANAEISGNGGSINGMLAAKKFETTNGTELHAFTICKGEKVWDLIPDDGGIRIYKTASETSAPLKGAEFTLYELEREQEVYGPFPTDEDGILEILELRPGQYKLIETRSPNGYALPQIHEWTFNIDVENKGENNNMQIIYIKNTLSKGSAEFLKLDMDDSSIKLADAVFSLYKYNDETDQHDLISTDHTTDADGALKFDNLLPGKYRLTETAAPDGYYLTKYPDTDFEIKLDQKNIPIPLDTVTIYNQKLAELTIIKKDSGDNSIILSGAVFDLYNSDPETSEYKLVSSNHTTDENGKIVITRLEPGNYKLIETAAPDGYYLDPDNETMFTISVDQEQRIVAPETLNLTNTLLGQVQIYKVDSDNSEILLGNAVFDLYKYNDETSEYELLRSNLTTDENGSLLIKDLEPGDYKLDETQPPAGYAVEGYGETLFTVTL